MISFSYRGFREHLSQPLGKVEMRFLVKTFATASLYFLLFGFLVGLFDWVLTTVTGSRSWAIGAACTIIGAIAYIPLHFCSMSYRNDPLRRDSGFAVGTYALLTISFLFMFLGITNVLFHLISPSWESATTPTSDQKNNIWFSIAFIFGTTILIYMIPVVIAFYVTNKRTILSLSRFLNFCYIAYLVLFLASLVLVFVSNYLTNITSMVIYVLISIILLLSPIITIYRMKTVAPYINHEDPVERKKWEDYFSFEISFQLLQLAFHVARIMIMFVTNNSRSRLG